MHLVVFPSFFFFMLICVAFCVCAFISREYFCKGDDDAVWVLAGTHSFNREKRMHAGSQLGWKWVAVAGWVYWRGAAEWRHKQGEGNKSKKRETFPQFGTPLMSPPPPPFDIAFTSVCRLPMAPSMRGGGELVLHHTAPAFASPENTWQRASSKATSRIPQPARALRNQLPTTLSTVFSALFTISRETDKIFTNLHIWTVRGKV